MSALHPVLIGFSSAVYVVIRGGGWLDSVKLSLCNKEASRKPPTQQVMLLLWTWLFS
jgi:hypothetical protein